MNEKDSAMLKAIRQLQGDALNVGLLPTPFRIIEKWAKELVEERDALAETVKRLSMAVEKDT